MAVEKVQGVSGVETDMNEHTVTVGFDDSVTTVDKIVEALYDAGYVVKERRKLQ